MSTTSQSPRSSPSESLLTWFCRNLPPVDVKLFPVHLEHLCLQDLKTYTALLMPITPKPETEDDHYLVRGGNVEVEMSGNWSVDCRARAKECVADTKT